MTLSLFLIWFERKNNRTVVAFCSYAQVPALVWLYQHKESLSFCFYCHKSLNIGSYVVCSKVIAELFFTQFPGGITRTENCAECQSRLCEVLDQYLKLAHVMTALKLIHM